MGWCVGLGSDLGGCDFGGSPSARTSGDGQERGLWGRRLAGTSVWTQQCGWRAYERRRGVCGDVCVWRVRAVGEQCVSICVSMRLCVLYVLSIYLCVLSVRGRVCGAVLAAASGCVC